MASANSGLQITNLDFNSIKDSFKTFLQQQDKLKDYNYDASALSVLIDLLAYNTQYNAYYLNMVANEMFLDSAVQRNSVISHAKLLNYMPTSAAAPRATVRVVVNGVTGTSSLTMPRYTQFISEAIDSVNYTFVTKDAYTTNVTANTAVFDDVNIIQGTSASYSFTVNKTTNPKLTFDIPDSTIDTSTIVVTVQESSSNLTYETYTQTSDYLKLSPSSKVYFLQEGLNGKYQIYFGDGILGYALKDDNVVNIRYVATDGTNSYGANSFSLMSTIGGYSNVSVYSTSSATKGKDKESINSVKYTAPKSYAAQGRAVTKEDYMYLIQKNSTDLPIESITVWGGEENNPPVYGRVFCSIKPAGGYTLTESQKQKLIVDVIRPISVITIYPVILDPDYTYIKLKTNVLYDPKKTTLTAGQLKQLVIATIRNFSNTTLNAFNATLKLPELTTLIQYCDPSVITNETDVRVEKKLYPVLNSSASYQAKFGMRLKRNYSDVRLLSSLYTDPDITVTDTSSFPSVSRTGVFYREVPPINGKVVGSVTAINIENQGFNYTKTPVVTVYGDGSGAKAYPIMANGRLISIVVTDAGSNYSEAYVEITPAAGDKTGQLAAAVPILDSSVGYLQTFYYKNLIPQVINSNAGTISYSDGVVTLKDFSATAINNEFSYLRLSAIPSSTIITSEYNRILTIDEFDPMSVEVTVTAIQK
jgi:hypothetical protein